MQSLLIPLILSLVIASSPVCAEERDKLLIGLIASGSDTTEFIQTTVEALERSFAPNLIELEKIPHSSQLQEFVLSKYDFLISPPASLPQLPALQNRIIASAGSSVSNDLGLPSGGTIIVPTKEKYLKALSDLRGKKVVSTLPNDLAGWLSIEYEFKKEGLDATPFLRVLILSSTRSRIFSTRF